MQDLAKLCRFRQRSENSTVSSLSAASLFCNELWLPLGGYDGNGVIDDGSCTMEKVMKRVQGMGYQKVPG